MSGWPFVSIFMCYLDFDTFRQMLGVIESSVVFALQQTEEPAFYMEREIYRVDTKVR